MSKKQTVLSKIVLKLSGKNIELSVEEARELKDILAGLFEEKIIYRDLGLWWYPYVPYHQGPYWTISTISTGQYTSGGNTTNFSTNDQITLTSNSA